MQIGKIAVILLVVGLVVGLIAGYGVAFFIYQPQISELQVDLFQTQYGLSETQSSLSESQSEAKALREQLIEAKDEIAMAEQELMKAQTNITSLKTDLSELEKEYATISSEYKDFRSSITSLIRSLKKKVELVEQIFKAEVYGHRHEYYSETMMENLEPYVDAVGDAELSSIFRRMKKHWESWNSDEFHDAFVDLKEMLTWLLQRDLIKLDRALAA